ncbi:MAG: putative O-glycosylation ligase, exosortase A system-associated, partial [Pseudomonadota bacterium]|nr:putative O-glycosylation ligase, exosortase A system-associated [Pseudomonadota bacterium]
MRDIILTLAVFGSLPFILRNAWIGVLVWSWLSYMNPHRLTWGFAYSMPFAQAVAATLLLALIVGKEKSKLPINKLTVVWLIYVLWMCVTTVNAIYPESAGILLNKIIKIQLIAFVTILLINSRERIEALIWVIVLSIGFYSIKGGVFTLLTGGQYRVWGPASTDITENNALAVATLMIVPLFIYLYQVASN